MSIRYRLVILGSLPRTTLELLQSRFSTDQVEAVPASTAVTVTVIDQPALQALLGLIWDTGGQLLSVETESGSTWTASSRPQRHLRRPTPGH